MSTLLENVFVFVLRHDTRRFTILTHAVAADHEAEEKVQKCTRQNQRCYRGKAQADEQHENITFFGG